MAYDPAELGWLPKLPTKGLPPPPLRVGQSFSWRFPISYPDILATTTFFPQRPAYIPLLRTAKPYLSMTSAAINPVVITPFGWNIQRPTRLELRNLTVLQRGTGVLPPLAEVLKVAPSLTWLPRGGAKPFRALSTQVPPPSLVEPLNPIATGRCIEFLDQAQTASDLTASAQTASDLLAVAQTTTDLSTLEVC